MSKKASALVRRFPDPDVPGRLLTYLTLNSICEVVGVCTTTIGRWASLGYLRHTDRLSGARNYALVDAIRLKSMTRSEAEAQGIALMPEDKLRYNAMWREAAQYRTRNAEKHREEWDDYDVVYVIEEVAKDTPIEDIAKTLGRTYDGVAARIDILRESGDIPPAHADDGWMDRARSLLTEDEKRLLSAQEPVTT